MPKLRAVARIDRELDRFSFGWYNEEKIHFEIEPKSSTGWTYKPYRPFMVADCVCSKSSILQDFKTYNS